MNKEIALNVGLNSLRAKLENLKRYKVACVLDTKERMAVEMLLVYYDDAQNGFRHANRAINEALK